MTWIYRNIFHVAIVCAVLHYAIAIDCYVCKSGTSDGCGEDPDTPLLIVTNNVQSGCTACVKEFSALGTVWSSVERSCSSIFASDACSNILGYGTCYCTTTFCNQSIVTTGSITITSMALLIGQWIIKVLK